jgi:hypothetical protein
MCLFAWLKTEACDISETQQSIMQFHTEGPILSKVAASRQAYRLSGQQPASQPATQSHRDLPDVRAVAPEPQMTCQLMLHCLTALKRIYLTYNP